MPTTKIIVKNQRKYGLFHFLFDALFTVCTGGLWLIYVYCREQRNRG